MKKALPFIEREGLQSNFPERSDKTLSGLGAPGAPGRASVEDETPFGPGFLAFCPSWRSRRPKDFLPTH